VRLAERGLPHEVYRFQAGHGSLVVDEKIRHVEAQLVFARLAPPAGVLLAAI